jgi:tRNA (guanine10-N2)-dimethyltransferase
MNKLFIHLSGEAGDLPSIECQAILEAENVPYKIIDKLDQILIIESDKERCKIITTRSAYTHRLCLLLTQSKLEDFYLNENHLVDLELKGVATFSVRIKKIKIPKHQVDSAYWEKRIGKEIIKSSKGLLKVDLDNPEYEFIGIITGEYFIFGLTLSVSNRRALDLRQGKYKPRFHPGVMHPRLARAMVNLAQMKKGDAFIDPFLGTAGIGVEAGLIGCKVIGIELEKKMIYASIKNLKFYDIDFDIIYGDSRYFPLRNIEGGATDPPYGISTSTHGFKLEELMKAFLLNLDTLLKPGAYFTIAIPSNFNISGLLAELKLKIINSFDIYVHRSLTRRIIILRR